MNVLHLPIYKEAFEVMHSGEKLREYRKPSKWIMSRLFDKNSKRKTIDAVRFPNGYGNVPYFTRVYKGFFISKRKFTQTYSNGLTILIEPGDVIIKLGRIIESSFENELFN